jgi:hypothetical protein
MSDNNRALLARVLEGKRRSQRPIVLDAPGPDLAF